MRYFYTRPESYNTQHGKLYTCNHPLYSQCALYLKGNEGLAVIQQRFNPRLKVTWWGPIDPWLIEDIYSRPRFETYFSEKASESKSGIFPSVTIRQIMWALRMKPLPREYWESNLTRLE